MADETFCWSNVKSRLLCVSTQHRDGQRNEEDTDVTTVDSVHPVSNNQKMRVVSTLNGARSSWCRKTNKESCPNWVAMQLELLCLPQPVHLPRTNRASPDAPQHITSNKFRQITSNMLPTPQYQFTKPLLALEATLLPPIPFLPLANQRNTYTTSLLHKGAAQLSSRAASTPRGALTSRPNRHRTNSNIGPFY